MKPDSQQQGSPGVVMLNQCTACIKVGMMMVKEVKFHNMVKMRVQAQIFNGRTLLSGCVAGPGETVNLSVNSERFDIFVKNSSTGWEIVRKLDTVADSLTLIVHNGQYQIK
jgi:hypothetical protein